MLGFLWEIKITGYVISELVWNAFIYFLMALYTFSLCILEHFNHFLGDLEITLILYVCFTYVFFERFKLTSTKINKTASNDLNEEEHRQPKNRELKVFERVILLPFWKTFFSKYDSYYRSTIFCPKLFSWLP